jgi:HAMP domain-containing protein
VRLTLRMKIIGGFLVAVLSTLALGGFAAKKFSDFSGSSEASAQSSARQSEQVADIESQYLLGNFYANSVFAAKTPQDAELARPKWRGAISGATEKFIAFRDLPMSPQARAVYDKTSENISWNNKLANSIMGGQFPVPQPEVAVPTLEELIADSGLAYDAKQSEARALLAQLRAQISTDGSDGRNAVKAEADSSLRGLLLLVAVICLGLLAFAVGLSYLLVRRLRGTVQALNQVAEGDLTARAPEGGSDEVAEMGAALNSSLNTIHDVVRQIEEDAERLSTLAREQLVPPGSVSGNASGTTVLMANSTRNAQELAEMADNLNAMIMVFQTAKDPETVA